MVRARRRRRTALRWSLLVALWAGVATALGATAAFGARWVVAPGRFPLTRIEVVGAREARESELVDLARGWMGRNILVIDLTEVEAKLREHPWIGPRESGGTIRIHRHLPGGLLVNITERTVGGMALLNGVVYLVDPWGRPIDRYGPRYAHHNYPIIVGSVESLPAGVGLTRALAATHPDLLERVSEIDVFDPHQAVLKFEEETYDVVLSREDYTRNLDNYLRMRDVIESEDEGAVQYVDLRWKDRITLMRAPAAPEKNGTNGGS